MSRLDWFTIAVVAICLAAIVFLLFKTTNLLSGEDPSEEVKTELQEDLEDMGILDNETIDPGNTDMDSDAVSSDDDLISTPGDEGSDEIISDEDEILDEEEEDTPTYTATGDYLVIAGSFSLQHNAENFVSQLKKKGYSNAEVTKFNSGRFASVIVDKFDSSTDASTLVKELKAAGIDSYVQRKRGAN